MLLAPIDVVHVRRADHGLWDQAERELVILAGGRIQRLKLLIRHLHVVLSERPLKALLEVKHGGGRHGESGCRW